MPVHDWTKVEARIYHDFHTAWIIELRNALNNRLLPEGFYALAEQHVGRLIPEILTLHEAPLGSDPAAIASSGGLAVADAPPRVRKEITISSSLRSRSRTLAVRHVSGHRLIALIEIVSPSNKDRRDHVDELANKIRTALSQGIHVLLIDLIPPGANDSQAIHESIWNQLDDEADPDEFPMSEPLTLASYVAGSPVEAYLEPLSAGSVLPDMPLFLYVDRYVNVPLEPTYQAAFHGTHSFWRQVLEPS
jgi:hypothetical protein